MLHALYAQSVQHGQYAHTTHTSARTALHITPSYLLAVTFGRYSLELSLSSARAFHMRHVPSQASYYKPRPASDNFHRSVGLVVCIVASATHEAIVPRPPKYTHIATSRAIRADVLLPADDNRFTRLREGHGENRRSYGQCPTRLQQCLPAAGELAVAVKSGISRASSGGGRRRVL